MVYILRCRWGPPSPSPSNLTYGPRPSSTRARTPTVSFPLVSAPRLHWGGDLCVWVRKRVPPVMYPSHRPPT